MFGEMWTLVSMVLYLLVVTGIFKVWWKLYTLSLGGKCTYIKILHHFQSIHRHQIKNPCSSCYARVLSTFRHIQLTIILWLAFFLYRGRKRTSGLFHLPNRYPLPEVPRVKVKAVMAASLSPMIGLWSSKKYPVRTSLTCIATSPTTTRSGLSPAFFFPSSLYLQLSCQSTQGDLNPFSSLQPIYSPRKTQDHVFQKQISGIESLHLLVFV